MTVFDVIIIGAGTMGASAGYYLSRSGASVLLLDAYNPPHKEGSHHGETRLFRHAYSGEDAYLHLALHAEREWEMLEQAASRKLFHRTGVLSLDPEDSPLTQGKENKARKFELPIEVLMPEEIEGRWPGLIVPRGYRGLYESRGGVLSCEAIIESFQQLSVQNGAKLQVNSPVERVSYKPTHVEVSTRTDRYIGRQLLLTAGARSGTILPDLKLPVEAVRKPIAWFEPKTEHKLFDSRCFPGFIINTEFGEFYGFPSFTGSGLKMGRHDGGEILDWGQPTAPFGSYPADEIEFRQLLQQFMPKAEGRLLRGDVCLYERTPDEHGIIDQHPDYSHVYIATGFSGHGFKFASSIGQTVSDWMIHNVYNEQLKFFALSRF
ncbi:N-methyl-L-tryptophan oxidase [Paenibacillus sp. 1_12]|uniref:N-methyl-L-tryptophan oxidase n=1 Tax=Paenibacillus sp. 1_12 TaxID=1566278 RepID=UPI0008F19DB7|nr:N-methyl-L-tryptophan oxidase [Paenibacillus sp. 1_12]SFL10494.1 N-methyl-L-tryptophan oxidase [Paenibacillus sp. 1_12]